MDRGQHHAGNARGRQRRRQTKQFQRSTPELGDRGSGRMDPTGAHSHALEGLRRGLKAVASEPAEQLLGTVTHEDSPDAGPQYETSKLHRVPLSMDCLTGQLYRGLHRALARDRSYPSDCERYRRRARNWRFLRRLPQTAISHQLPCWLRERS